MYLFVCVCMSDVYAILLHIRSAAVFNVFILSLGFNESNDDILFFFSTADSKINTDFIGIV